MRENGQQLFELWAVSGRAGDLLPENLLATGCLQLGGRAGEVLRLSRDAGIAVNHSANLHQNFASEKPKAFSGLGLMFAVGTPITERPPHRSERAQFGHSAP